MKLLIWFTCAVALIEYATTFYLMWRGRINNRLREVNPFLRFCQRIGFWPFQIARLALETMLFWFLAVQSNWIPFAVLLPGLLFAAGNNVRIMVIIKRRM